MVNKILYILIVILLVGCKSNKKIIESYEYVYLDSSYIEEENSSYMIDSSFYNDWFVDEKVIEESFEMNDELVEVLPSELVSFEEELIHTSASMLITSEEFNIINLTDTAEISDDNYGIIGYNIPEYLRENEYSTIKLRITKEDKIESVIIGDRNIPIVPVGSEDKVIVETILISDSMSAELYFDDDVFDVQLNSKKNQNIFDDGYTEWVWRIRPLKEGNYQLRLVISISGRDKTVYEKNIEVQNNFKWSFMKWFEKWWQAITTVIVTPILIPLFIWLYKRRKKKSSSE